MSRHLSDHAPKLLPFFGLEYRQPFGSGWSASSGLVVILTGGENQPPLAPQIAVGNSR